LKSVIRTLQIGKKIVSSFTALCLQPASPQLPTLQVAVAQRTAHLQNAITAPVFQAQAKQMMGFVCRKTADLISCSENTVF